MEAKVDWAGGMRFVGQADSGHAVVMDTAAEHGGGGSAVKPSELLLLGLAGCTGMDVVRQRKDGALVDISLSTAALNLLAKSRQRRASRGLARWQRSSPRRCAGGPRGRSSGSRRRRLPRR